VENRLSSLFSALAFVRGRLGLRVVVARPNARSTTMKLGNEENIETPSGGSCICLGLRQAVYLAVEDADEEFVLLVDAEGSNVEVGIHKLGVYGVVDVVML